MCRESSGRRGEAAMPGFPGGARESDTRAVTMVEVARTLGLSHQTVSRVLNDHPSVRPDTRARVRKAIEDLGYRRNSAARTLATRRSRTVGVVSFDTTLYGPAGTLAGVEHAAQEAGYSVSVAIARALTTDTVLDALDRLVAQGVEGIVVIAPLLDMVRALPALRGSVPLVVVESGRLP